MIHVSSAAEPTDLRVFQLLKSEELDFTLAVIRTYLLFY
jgi:hypothetical protein